MPKHTSPAYSTALWHSNWVIDFGPNEGKADGQIVAAITPEGVVKQKTHTGVALTVVLARK